MISHAEQPLAIQNADNIKTVTKERICFQVKWDYLCVKKISICVILVCSKITHSPSPVFTACHKIKELHENIVALDVGVGKKIKQ